jgi:hypothetical protein
MRFGLAILAVIVLMLVGVIWWRIFRAVLPFRNTSEYHNDSSDA